MALRRKWLLIPVLAALAMIAARPPAAPAWADAANPITITLEGNPGAFHRSPLLENDTLLVPLRELSGQIGASITWNGAEEAATIAREGKALSLKIGSPDAVLTGRAIKLPTVPRLIDGVTYAPLRVVCEALGFVVAWDDASDSVRLVREDALVPAVGTADKLRELLKKSAIGMPNYKLEQDTVVPTAAAGKSKSLSGAADYSQTNVQVEGVDEGDIVKTDGRYIYRTTETSVVIVRAVPANAMSVAATISLQEDRLRPTALYVDGSRLIVIGSASETVQPPQPMPAAKKKMVAPVSFAQRTKAVVYDLSDMTRIVKLRELELPGSYATSRKIGSALYVFANGQFYSKLKSDMDAPTFRDSAVGNEERAVGYDRIRYFPEAVGPSYLMVAGLDLDAPQQPADVTMYLGASDKVYASADNLYAAVSRFDAEPEKPKASDDVGIMPIPQAHENTLVYKFRLDGGLVRPAGKGEVPGTALNQFSMDEYDGYFRIATTVDNPRDGSSKNNVYVLDEAMNTVGKLENIAPGERIYSVRFMGGRGYMVTFKSVDPLFTLDLSAPRAPRILGALKIPGYSDYLHPYDETHLIGFGKETVELSNDAGQTGGSFAYYQGMKIAMFDVTDVNRPVELFKETIGDRGTDSDLLRDHKALMFDKRRGLMAFPVSLAEVKRENGKADPLAYGALTFQGAYVYGINPDTGFTLRGRITHLSDEDVLKSGYSTYYGPNRIDRTLTIGDTLYTVSQGKIAAHDLGTLREAGSVRLPG